MYIKITCKEFGYVIEFARCGVIINGEIPAMKMEHSVDGWAYTSSDLNITFHNVAQILDFVTTAIVDSIFEVEILYHKVGIILTQ